MIKRVNGNKGSGGKTEPDSPTTRIVLGKLSSGSLNSGSAGNSEISRPDLDRKKKSTE